MHPVLGLKFELDLRRRQIRELAALRYAAAPNDVAPAVGDDPAVSEDLPAPSLRVDGDHVGVGTRR